MRRLLLLCLLALVVCVPPAQAWSWPADGDVLDNFTFDRAHPYAGGVRRGIDIAGAAGASVRAPVSGTIAYAGSLPTNGLTLTIATADGYSVTLVHLGSIAVKKGTSVDEGATVGTIGPSGDADHDRPYVYLGVRTTSDPQGYLDPLRFLPPRKSGSSPLPPPPASQAPPVAAQHDRQTHQGSSAASAPAPSPAPAATRAPAPASVAAPSPVPASSGGPSPNAVADATATAPASTTSPTPAADTGESGEIDAGGSSALVIQARTRQAGALPRSRRGGAFVGVTPVPRARSTAAAEISSSQAVSGHVPVERSPVDARALPRLGNAVRVHTPARQGSGAPRPKRAIPRPATRP